MSQPPTDFDFMFGRWRVTHRRLTSVFDRSCDTWWEFQSTTVAYPLMGGWGNCDDNEGVLPTGAQFRGATLRLFVPETRTWRIWWMSPAGAGELDPPVEGRFDGPIGTFDGPIAPDIDGICRFVWDVTEPTRPQWRQYFSYDDGRTWGEPNWVMDFEPIA